MKKYLHYKNYWKNSSKPYFFSFLVFSTFLFFGILTLSDYGISWDNPIHFRRGQAYLNLLMSGRKDFGNLPPYNLDTAKSDSNYHERSFYQSDDYDANYHLKKDVGHPPLNDILASLTNNLFYRSLGLLKDIQGYQVLIVILAAAGVSLVFYFGAENFGLLMGGISALFMGLYPLFWSESHFNIKDPIETTFFSFTIYFLWKSWKQKDTKYIYIASIFSGLALATKFNIFFAIFIGLIWATYLLLTRRKAALGFGLSKNVLFGVLLFPVVMLGILFISWPYLWQNSFTHLLEIFGFYKDIGTGDIFQSTYLLLGFNLYPLIWIIITTPPLLLVSFFVGMIFLFFEKDQKSKELLVLWSIWFFLTIFRVVMPDTSIYGGVRQIMEYIPPMALIGGYGIFKLKQYFKVNSLIVFLFAVIILVIPIIKLHPNENVYFNFLIGGINGAEKIHIPATGNTFGNVYNQGINWINLKAFSNAKLTLIQGTTSNLPLFLLRPDINYANTNFSGIRREGEYIMEMTYIYETKAYYYAWDYVDKFLDPIYEIKVDNVSILKIWKNDLEHTKPEYKLFETKINSKVDLKSDKNSININLENKNLIGKIVLSFKEINKDCLAEGLTGIWETSVDGANWIREGDPGPFEQIGRKREMTPTSFTQYFAATDAKYLRYTFNANVNCSLEKPMVEVFTLQ